MISYKWSIEKVVVAEDNLVTQVYWRCEAEGFACAGVRNLIRGDSFTPYSQLTEQQVLAWCYEPETIVFDNLETTVKHLKEETETQVASQIQRQLDQVNTEPALPWV